MHRINLLPAVLFLLVGSALAADRNLPVQLVMFSTQARVEVDSNGAVTSVTPNPKLSPAIGGAIEAQVKQWKFSAPMKDGHPVGGITYTQLQTCAAPTDGKYLFAVQYRDNGPGMENTGVPRFPRRAMRYDHEEAKITVTYVVLPNGSAQFESAQLLKGDKHFEQDFQSAIKAWVRESKFQPELVDGVEVATRMATTIVFSGDRFDSLAQAKSVERSRQQELAPQQPSCQQALAASQEQSNPVVSSSPFRLLRSGQ